MENNIEEMDDGEWEEELIMVDLSGLIDADWFSRIGDRCKIVGIDSEHPVLQLGRHIFTGQYQDTIGTRVLFEKENSTDSTWYIDDEDASPSLHYFGNTFKILDMKKIFLAEKNEETQQEEEDGRDGCLGQDQHPEDNGCHGNTETGDSNSDAVHQ